MRFIFTLLAATSLYSGNFRVIDGKEFPLMGMFAAANQILGQLFIYETGQPVKIDGLLVDFDSYGLYYDPSRGTNWWNYYFEPICIGNIENANWTHPPKRDYYQAFKRRRQFKRHEAAALVQKYIRVKPHILEKVSSFTSKYFEGIYTIGVHYRGTDKSREAPKVSYDTVIEKIAEYIPHECSWQIFAATDEQQFLDALLKAFPHKILACQACRSEDQNGVHFSNHPSYLLGEEALIDSLLLSKCNLLIRTSSNLSLWSTYFNQDLPVVMLNYNFGSWKNAEPE